MWPSQIRGNLHLSGKFPRLKKHLDILGIFFGGGVDLITYFAVFMKYKPVGAP